jgi:hypothetical protein
MSIVKPENISLFFTADFPAAGRGVSSEPAWAGSPAD